VSKELLEKEKALAEEKAAHIKALLDERETLIKSTEERIVAIGEELKALGYKAPRKTRTVPADSIGE
jgi:hypothetical protein